MNFYSLRSSSLICLRHNIRFRSFRNYSGANFTAASKFSQSKVGDFTQDSPYHENAFLSDQFLIRNLQRMMPTDIFNTVKSDLVRFGNRVSSDIWKLGQECAANEPYLHKTSAWGKKVDEIVTCDAWKQQKRISAEEGLVAIAYEREFHEFSRLYQVIKLFMYSPSSGLYSCPLAMTDGAAKTFEANDLLPSYQNVFSHLTTRNPDNFWTSGQWMTEKRGGSDVAKGTETLAVPVSGDSNLYSLYGYKWFSSATDSDIALTLGRITDSKGNVTPGTDGVTMFLIKTRNDDGKLNGIEVMKLKNKLGTRQLPTGELLIDGALAEKISDPGRGISCISSMLTITRLHNVISSVAGPRKLINLARDYARRRQAFGQVIANHPLHLKTLAKMEAETRGCTALMLDLALKLGLEDCRSIADEDALLLRLMTPVAKMYTAKRSVELVSEGLECFGGQGYIEDTGLPGFLRDAQVLPIWEGTSSVMSLDVLRAIHKTNGEALLALQSCVSRVTKNASQNPKLRDSCTQLESVSRSLFDFIAREPSKVQVAARDLTYSLAHIYIASLLVEHACNSGDEVDVFTVRSWMQRDIVPVVTHNRQGSYDVDISAYKAFVYEGYDGENLIASTFIR